MKKKLQETYKKMSKRERLILYGTSLVIGGLFVDRLVLAPMAGKLEALDRAIIDEENGIRRSLHVLVQKNRIVREAKEFAQYSVDKKKNSEEEMTSLLKEIETLAAQSQVTLIYVKPSTTRQEEGGIVKNLATLECESQMEQVAGFFHALESSTKLLRIEKFEIQPKNKESSIARCSMTVSKTVLG